MKRRLIIVLSLVLGIGLFGATAAYAKEMHNDVVNIGSNEIIDSSLYVGGKSITIAGTVKGDVFCAGQMIEITGVVEGDVICGGQSVRIGGEVKGDVRVAGQTVTITAKIGHSLTSFAQESTVEKEAIVGQDATIFGQAARLDGTYARDVVAGGSVLTVLGEFGRNASLYVDDVTLRPTAKIGGNLTYYSHKDATMEQGSAIVGKTERKDPPKEQKEQKPDWQERLSMAAYWLGAMLVIGLLLWLLMPKTLDATAHVMHKKMLVSLAIGTTSLILVPIVAILFFMTVIGIPVGVLLLVSYAISLFISWVIGAYFVGMWIVGNLNWPSKGIRLAALVIGLLALCLIGVVPYLGGVIVFLVMLVALGAVYYKAFDYFRRQRLSRAAKSK